MSTAIYKAVSYKQTDKGYRIDPNRTELDIELFKEKLSNVQSDHNIRVAEGCRPQKRSPKRITILVSETYLTSGGSIHWVQDLEAEVHKLCKEYYLDCDELEMESVDRSFICKDRKSKLYGRKIRATQFDNHLVCTRNFSGEDISLARAVVHYLTYHHYKKEDKRNGTTYYPGEGVVRVARNKQGSSLPPEKRERVTLCKTHPDRKSLSRTKIPRMGGAKLCKPRTWGR